MRGHALEGIVVGLFLRAGSVNRLNFASGTRIPVLGYSSLLFYPAPTRPYGRVRRPMFFSAVLYPFFSPRSRVARAGRGRCRAGMLGSSKRKGGAVILPRMAGAGTGTGIGIGIGVGMGISHTVQ